MARVVNVQMTGLSQVRAALGAAFSRVERAVDVAVQDFASDIKSNVSYAITQGPKSGVTYYRIYDAETGMMRVYAGNYSKYGPNKLVAVWKSDGAANLSLRHTASAPGQAPASDTGTLVNSIYVDRDGVARMTVGSRLAYAAYLEFGTRKIAPRPAWVPAVEKARPEFEAQMRAIIAGAVNASR